jgi:hypothetical protein
MRHQCMIMLIWLHVNLNQTLLRTVFTYTLIYRKVSVLYVNRTFVRFTHGAYNGFRTERTKNAGPVESDIGKFYCITLHISYL